MRLLQLAPAPDRLIDLHPNITVVRGLDAAERQLLVDTVAGLAQGSAPSVFGLLEAHDLFFDLSEAMLALLEVAGDDLRPVVTASDLPTAPRDPRAEERNRAERTVADLDEALRVAAEEQRRLRMTRDVAADALELVRQNAHEPDAGALERICLIDELTGQLAQIEEQRRPLLEAQAEQGREAEAAAAERVAIAAAAVELRNRHHEATVLCTELAARLDQARAGLDPGSVAAVDAAVEELGRVQAAVEEQGRVQAAVEAARADAGDVEAARADAGDVEVGDVEVGDVEVEAPAAEPPAAWLARVEARIKELEKRLTALGPSDVNHVASALSQLRALQDGEPVPSPAAQELADQLEVLDDDLAASAGVGAGTAALAEGRARLDAARDALMEAELAVRNRELDRDLVDRLELAHADVLLALEKAEGRFGGGRAARRLEEVRSAEQALLDELGLTSYSDYMMGYSLLNVDPEKEARLDAARAELAAAEDEMRTLEAETEAERARAEQRERRPALLEEASALLGHSVKADRVVSELRALRVPATIPPELVKKLQRSLHDAGVAVGDEDLSREELMVLAEAWLDEADSSAEGEPDLQRELAALTQERLAALAAVDAAEARPHIGTGE
ncbi:MAG: hypothetical protein ABWZ52_03530 [Acidimicrobiales bacterium]